MLSKRKTQLAFVASQSFTLAPSDNFSSVDIPNFNYIQYEMQRTYLFKRNNDFYRQTVIDISLIVNAII